MTRLLYLLAMALILPAAACTAVNSETLGPARGTDLLSVESTKQGIRFAASIEKSTFVDREPIILTLTLTNMTGKEIVLGEPADFWTCGVSLVRKSGKEMPGGIELMMPEMPSDFGRVFKPGESYSVYWDVTWRWPDDFPVDGYVLKAFYKSDPDAVGNRRIGWRGRIDLPALSFRTVLPRDDKEKAAYQLFVDNPCLSAEEPSPYLRLTVLHVLSDPIWGGVFASQAGIMEVEDLKKTGDKAGYVKALREYAEKQKSKPYYYHTALTLLGNELFDDGKYAEARAAYEKLTDGYFTQRLLSRCDERLSK